jgi:hypothetical protein
MAEGQLNVESEKLKVKASSELNVKHNIIKRV